ncbi:MAG TPA: hypothetical protein VFY60_12650 [Pyrinomonadaceae bacterium]|nr:hypothetical protein [Pyrinomonadaceae bacterium]
MAAIIRQPARSKFSVPLYLIGAALIGIAVLGFIYSFLPTKTNSFEIDLGAKLATLPGIAIPPGAPVAPDSPSAMIGPESNGTLTVSWPTTVASGWANVCRITYEPPRGLSLPPDYDVKASFFLTSTRGLVNEGLRAPLQPLARGKSEWVIPMEPAGPDGSPVEAQLGMSVVIADAYRQEFELQQLQSRIDNNLLTRNQTLGGSALSGVLGIGLLGIGRTKRKLKKAEPQPPAPAEELPVSNEFPMRLPPPPAPAPAPTGTGKKPRVIIDYEEDPFEITAQDPFDITPAEPERRVKGADTNTGGVTVPEPSEAKRYTDVTLYEDHLYPGDSLDEATKVPDDEPLVANNLYTLEVAIRLKRTGILSNLPAEREVENPRKEKETLTLHILATPLRGFKITDRLVTIKWPFNEDSESALFRLDIDPFFDPDRPGRIEIRILDEKLDLLDIVTLEVAIIAAEGMSIDGDMAARRLVWEDKEPEGLSLAGASHARLASIHVRPVTLGFTFDFVFRSAEDKTVNVSVFRNISDTDLTNLLARVRDFWTRLVITNYAHKLTVSAARYDTYLAELRDLGMQAWSLLFDTRTADQEGASERIGQITAALMNNDGATIQITYAADYGDFIFPWSILHPPARKDEPVDPLRFWGGRYRIEQVTRGPKKDRIDDRPINVLFALDPSFGDAPSQRKMFEDYQTAAKGELVVSTPISDQKTLVDQLIRDPAVHLLYFYCHGYAATRPGLLMADGVQSLKRIIEGIRKEAGNEESPAAAGLEKLMELTSKMAGESWIYLGDSQIKEADLRLLKFFARPRRPIVFLNMCQSADLVPSMSSGLVDLFLDHNASAVIGTESPMTGVFADAFARKVFDALFAGDNIGTALWKARRHFLLEGRNPLGLTYTLYGRADAKLGGQKS